MLVNSAMIRAWKGELVSNVISGFKFARLALEGDWLAPPSKNFAFPEQLNR